MLFAESYIVYTFVALKEFVNGRGMDHSLSACTSLRNFDKQLSLMCDVTITDYSGSIILDH